MSNIIAGIVRREMPYLDENIKQKKAIWERYERPSDFPVKMNPWDQKKSTPNFGLRCLIIDEGVMGPHVRGGQDELWKSEAGKNSPSEILVAIHHS